MFEYLGSAPDETGVAILAPNARDTTWDAITRSFGPDVDLINRALERVFDSVAIDPARIAVGGFSDGASYAISLGLINGDLFKRVAARFPRQIQHELRRHYYAWQIRRGRFRSRPPRRCSNTANGRARREHSNFPRC